MKKEDIIIVLLLFGLLVAWGWQQKVNYKPVNKPQPVAAADGTNMPPAVVISNAPVQKIEVAAVSTNPVVPELGAAAVKHLSEEKFVEIKNSSTVIRLSSWGGGVVSVTLNKYKARNEDDSGPVVLDFKGMPALSIRGIAGLDVSADYNIVKTADDSAVLVAETKEGLRLERELKLNEDYLVSVKDTFINKSGTPVGLPVQNIALGPMSMIESTASFSGVSFLGVDTMPITSGDSITRWDSEKVIPSEVFGLQKNWYACSMPDASSVPGTVEHATGKPWAWVAVKNKFFVQILEPKGDARDCTIVAERNMKNSKVYSLHSVAACVAKDASVVSPGTNLVYEYSYYAGPKEYNSLKGLPNYQVDVMELGSMSWFKWLCRMLLTTLNWLNSVIPNYGVAIILLTLIVKVIFWPVTHKSTESMKKMQKLQPVIKEIQEKFKDKPQKMHQEVMALYKEHKVNPMSGCLPILVQIPVFFALYTVLRSAVELRYAEFLWIKDLCEPENLLVGTIGFPINILPILMTVTSVLQTKLTPQTGDPQQQKMMMWMPVIFLFLLYNMASALVLYWTINQVLSIIQLAFNKWRGDHGMLKV